MEFKQIAAIGAFGMNYERTRVEAASMNIANANLVQNGQAVPFSPLRADASNNFIDYLENGNPIQMDITINSTVNTPRKVYQPDHPSSDQQGFLYYPDVNIAEEMVTLTSATRAYEANVKMLNTLQSMSMKAMEIGGKK